MHDVDDYPSARTIPGLVVYRYDAPLFFANAEDFRRRALAAAHSADPLRWFVLNVPGGVDSGRHGADRGRRRLGARRGKQELIDRLKAFGLAEKIGSDLIF